MSVFKLNKKRKRRGLPLSTRMVRLRKVGEGISEIVIVMTKAIKRMRLIVLTSWNKIIPW